MTYARNKALRMLDTAVREVLATERGAIAGMPGPDPAYRLGEHWAVAWGSRDLNDGSGYVEYYDDEEDAREHVPLYEGGQVVRRTVLSLPWVAVPQDLATEGASS